MTFGALGTCLSVLCDFILVCGCAVLDCLFFPILSAAAKVCWVLLRHYFAHAYHTIWSLPKYASLHAGLVLLCSEKGVLYFFFIGTHLAFFSTRCMICMTVCTCIYSVFNRKWLTWLGNFFRTVNLRFSPSDYYEAAKVNMRAVI